MSDRKVKLPPPPKKKRNFPVPPSVVDNISKLESRDRERLVQQEPILPPPPSLPGDLPPPPSLPSINEVKSSKYSNYTYTPSPERREAATSLMDELKGALQGDGLKLEKTKIQAGSASVEISEKKRYKRAATDYEEAAKKLMESCLMTNAATSFACSVLCTFISDGAGEAGMTLSGWDLDLPDTITNSAIFSGTRYLIRSIMTHDAQLFREGDKLLRATSASLFSNDDKKIIAVALQYGRKAFQKR